MDEARRAAADAAAAFEGVEGAAAAAAAGDTAAAPNPGDRATARRVGHGEAQQGVADGLRSLLKVLRAKLVGWAGGKVGGRAGLWDAVERGLGRPLKAGLRGGLGSRRAWGRLTRPR